jgi:catechol 2,3-dioxygenase-like lactoylglutathione lyase family enzyme
VFDHVTIRVSDRATSLRFYTTVLPTIGLENPRTGGDYADWGEFSLAQANESRPVTHGLHVGFAARSRADVDEFWRVGKETGYRDDGAPAPRPHYRQDYYGAFLLDPDGNSIEAVHHGGLREGIDVDHLWVRVAVVSASQRFYETVAPYAGFRLNADTQDRVQFVSDERGGSFSLVAGAPTKNVHLAFPASENETVNTFHRALIDAGYRDEGRPGERTVYHPGYYGAFVLDPDGNNVELVNHNRD